MRHNLRPCRLASTSHSARPCMFMDIPQHYFLKQVFPPYTLHKICNLHNSDSGCTLPPHHNPAFPLVFVAGSATSSAFGYASRPHAECCRTGGSSTARPKIPDATKCNPCQAHTYIDIVTTSTNVACISQPHTSPTNPHYTNQSSFGSAPSIPSTLYLLTSIMRFGTHELITKTVCARIVLPQARGS